jgi:signal transduction histidine kinase
VAHERRVTRLQELHRRYIAEETASALRHDLRNKFAAIANARFYLKRKVESAPGTELADDPKVPKFLDLISSELAAAEATLTNKLPTLPTVGEGVRCDVMIAIARRITGTSWEDVMVVGPTASAPLIAAIDAIEVELALACLIENAIDAGSHSVQLGATVEDGRIALEVVDDGNGLVEGADMRAFEQFFTTRPGRLGLGLNIAKRIAFRAKGDVEVSPRRDAARGVRARLLLPRAAR